MTTAVSPLTQALMSETRVPGAVALLRRGGAVGIAACGVESVISGKPVSAASTFRIGSMTKLFTAALTIKTLMKHGRSPEDQVTDILGDHGAAAGQRLKGLTVGSLLSHSSGLFGDLLTDYGDRDDRFERYVAHADQLESVAAPGVVFSYCNAGFVIAARICEVLENKPWATLFEHELLCPLSLPRTGGFSTQSGASDAAGHMADVSGRVVPVPDDGTNFTMTPAGATAWSAVGDVLSFVDHLLMRDPVGRAMASLRIKCQVETFADGFGLGTAHFCGGTILGHDGAVPGQQSFLRYDPYTGDAFILLTNGGDGRGLFHGCVEALADECDLRFHAKPPQWRDAPQGEDLNEYCGRYLTRHYSVTVSYDNDTGLRAVFEPIGQQWDFTEPVSVPLIRDIGERFLALLPTSSVPTHQVFRRDDNAVISGLTFRGRYFPKERVKSRKGDQEEVRYG